jgi:hypothetical protein
MRDEEMMAEIEDFLEGSNQPTYLSRHAGQWGPSADLVKQAGHQWSVRPIQLESDCNIFA